jgi:ribonuclease D
MISRFISGSVRRLFGAKTPQPKAAHPKVTHQPPTFDLVERTADLAPFLAALGRVQEVSLDTEADNMYHYRNRVCLLQFLVEGRVFLIDVLAPGMDLKPLWPELAKKHLVMHGSDFDLRLLHDLCGFRAHSLFDTMLAAQLLGRTRFGLAALLEEHFGVALDKSGQKANWSKRPITPKLLHYASLDVWHLPALRDILTRELKALGRLGWLEAQCQAQIDAGCTGFAPATEHDWRIGRSERLRGRGLTVLHAAWHWREAQAQRLDVPPFKVCGNELLLKLAHTAEAEDATPEAVLQSMHLGRRHDRLFPSLAAAVREGFAKDPASLPRRRGRDQRFAPMSNAELALLDRIKADRDGVAKKLGIDPTLIANRAQLAQIARGPDQLDAVLQRWQADLLRDRPSLQS